MKRVLVRVWMSINLSLLLVIAAIIALYIYFVYACCEYGKRLLHYIKTIKQKSYDKVFYSIRKVQKRERQRKS